MSFKTAKTVIRDVQKDVIDNYGRSLPEDMQKTFKAFRDKAMKNTKVRPNARFIKKIKQINNAYEFRRSLPDDGDTKSV